MKLKKSGRLYQIEAGPGNVFLIKEEDMKKLFAQYEELKKKKEEER